MIYLIWLSIPGQKNAQTNRCREAWAWGKNITLSCPSLFWHLFFHLIVFAHLCAWMPHLLCKEIITTIWLVLNSCASILCSPPKFSTNHHAMCRLLTYLLWNWEKLFDNNKDSLKFLQTMAFNSLKFSVPLVESSVLTDNKLTAGTTTITGSSWFTRVFYANSVCD